MHPVGGEAQQDIARDHAPLAERLAAIRASVRHAKAHLQSLRREIDRQFKTHLGTCRPLLTVATVLTIMAATGLPPGTATRPS